MSLPISKLFAAAGLEPVGPVRWGEPVPEAGPGVYAVAVIEARESTRAALAECPLDPARLDELLAECPELLLDGSRPTGAELARRLSAFWLADEIVLYVGLAGTSVRTRVRQYYQTPLGARRPHAGGWWLKTLGVLDELWVHFAPTSNYRQAENAMLNAFSDGVTPERRERLYDAGCVLPFANLRHPDGRVKAHGVTGATSAATRPTAKGHANHAAPASDRRPTAPRGAAIAPSAPSAPSATPTQRVTAKDLAAGRIRIPARTKHLLPELRGDVRVSVRGVSLAARWDPRIGPDRERSGVLAIGRGKLDRLVDVDVVLEAHSGDDLELR